MGFAPIESFALFAAVWLQFQCQVLTPPKWYHIPIRLLCTTIGLSSTVWLQYTTRQTEKATGIGRLYCSIGGLKVLNAGDVYCVNLKAIYDCLHKERQCKEHNQADMFVLCALSHGQEGCVYAMDGTTVLIQKIVELFDGRNCPALAGKPKMFFIQACQGSKLLVYFFIRCLSGN